MSNHYILWLLLFCKKNGAKMEKWCKKVGKNYQLSTILFEKWGIVGYYLVNLYFYLDSKKWRKPVKSTEACF